VNLLGNLVLVHKVINSKAGNRSINEKIKILEKSDIASTKKLIEKIKLGETVWGKGEIVNRQKELAKIAYENVWNF